MTESEGVVALRTAVASYLDAAFGGHETDADDDFVVRRGSARVFIRPLEQEGRTFVVIWAVTNVGVRVDGELTGFLATENARLSFGKFGLNEQASAVQLVHALLGDFLNRAELEVAVNAVAETADEYDDTIKSRFGGHLPGEVADLLERIVVTVDDAAGPEPAAAGGPGAALQALFGVLSVVAAIVGAILAYLAEESLWLSGFVAVLALHLVGRAVPDVITDRHRVRRALYFLLLPALATALLAAAYAVSATWWLSTVLGLLGGLLLSAIVAPLLFPRIHVEETADSLRRWARQWRAVDGG